VLIESNPMLPGVSLVCELSGPIHT
jgi:hypothetical protein